MVCWLCEGRGECACCAYMREPVQPKLEAPPFVTHTFNSAAEIGEATRLTSIFFLEKASFGEAAVAGGPARKRQHADDDDDLDLSSDGDSDSDFSDGGGSDSDDCCCLSSLSALWKSSTKNVKKKKARHERTGEEVVRQQIEAQFRGSDAVPACITRLLQFIRVLEILNQFPDACEVFEENEYIMRMLIASHLKMIVGKKDWKKHMTQLYPLIESVRDLANVINVIWVTNRQQGKTTVLARFAAALALMSPAGGDDFLYVYSTTLNRAQALVNSAKDYISWINKKDNVEIHEQLRAIGLPDRAPLFKDNSERFSVESWTSPGTFNMVRARPKAANSCRGDAPKAAIFDEIAFVEENFWNKFAYPLLGVTGRVFTLATTPGRLDSFFDVFMKKVRDQKEASLFMLVNHSLMCDACFKKGLDNCYHKLYLIPPWKSTLRFKGMLKLVPEKNKDDFQAEVYGRLYESDQAYFPRKITEYTVLERPAMAKPVFGKNPVVYFACDPPSHMSSHMGLCAITYTTSGTVVVLGMAEISMHRCEMPQMEMCVSKFVSRVLRHACFRKHAMGDMRAVPIVECNNNEILSAGIVVAIRETALGMGCRYIMPFRKIYFATAITEDIGIWCTEGNKIEAIRELYTLMVKHQVVFIDKMVTMGPVHLLGAVDPTVKATKELLRDELVQFKDDEKGKVSGKTSETNDDMAIAVLWAVKYSANIMLIASRENLLHVPMPAAAPRCVCRRGLEQLLGAARAPHRGPEVAGLEEGRCEAAAEALSASPEPREDVPHRIKVEVGEIGVVVKPRRVQRPPHHVHVVTMGLLGVLLHKRRTGRNELLARLVDSHDGRFVQCPVVVEEHPHLPRHCSSTMRGVSPRLPPLPPLA